MPHLDSILVIENHLVK